VHPEIVLFATMIKIIVDEPFEEGNFDNTANNGERDDRNCCSFVSQFPPKDFHFLR
jgi:hypothetical protein